MGRRGHNDEDFAREIQAHLELETDRLIRDGMSPEDARAAAYRAFGNVARTRERFYESRRVMWLGHAQQDVRFAVRTLIKSPGFTFAIILTLALGIGANATMFGVIDRLLVSPPQHLVQPDQLRHLYLERRGAGDLGLVSRRLTYPDFKDIEGLPAFASIAAYAADVVTWTMGSGSDARRVQVQQASASLFPTLGVRPARGRFYAVEEDVPGAAPTAVLSEEFWAREFERDPGIIGRVVQLNRGRYEVVGIAPTGFTGAELSPVDVWLPLRASAFAESGRGAGFDDRGQWWIRAVVRLKSGVTSDAADAQLTATHIAARRAYAKESAGLPEHAGRAYAEHEVPRLFTASVIAARGPSPSTTSAISLWSAGVSLVVLLIACANVANLLLVRGIRVQRELALRVALGADRRRLLAQSMTEAALLAGAGALAALGVSWGSSRMVHAMLIPDVAFSGSGIGLRLLVFISAAAVITALFAGILPAVQASRTAGADALRAASRGNSSARSTLRGTLMVAQITLSVVLLVGAGLFVRSLWQALDTDVGFDYAPILAVFLEENADPAADRVAQRRRRTELYRAALARISTLPGVRSAALSAATTPLFTRDGFGPEELRVPGVDSIPRVPGGGPYKYSGTEDFFATLGVTVTRGRAFEPAEFKDGTEPVAMVNETFARTIWPDRDPLAQCIQYYDPDRKGAPTPCRRIVGIFKDLASFGVDERKPLQVAYPTLPDTYVKGLIVRAEGDPASLIPSIRQAFLGISSDVRFVEVASGAERFNRAVRSWRLGSTMFTAFGLLALLVAAVGLYSNLAFGIAQRRRELGIRAALGANRQHLIRVVMAQAARFVTAGLVLGTAIALAAGRFLERLLFGVAVTDLPVYGLVILTLIAAGGLAGLIPAWRATSIHAKTALEAE